MNRQKFIDAVQDPGEAKDNAVDGMAHHTANDIMGTGDVSDVLADWMVNGVPAPYGQMTAAELVEEAKITNFLED